MDTVRPRGRVSVNYTIRRSRGTLAVLFFARCCHFKPLACGTRVWRKLARPCQQVHVPASPQIDVVGTNPVVHACLCSSYILSYPVHHHSCCLSTGPSAQVTTWHARIFRPPAPSSMLGATRQECMQMPTRLRRSGQLSLAQYVFYFNQYGKYSRSEQGFQSIMRHELKRRPERACRSRRSPTFLFVGARIGTRGMEESRGLRALRSLRAVAYRWRTTHSPFATVHHPILVSTRPRLAHAPPSLHNTHSSPVLQVLELEPDRSCPSFGRALQGER